MGGADSDRLTDPLSEADPEAWTVRFLAHVVLGLIAWHSLLWTIQPANAAWVVPLVYFVAWECLVQRLGAGAWDAALDTMAVQLGALVGLELIAGPNPWAFGAIMAVGGAVIWHGVWRRADEA